MAILIGSIISMLSRVGYIDKQVLIAAAPVLIHLPAASLSDRDCKNATKMDLGVEAADRERRREGMLRSPVHMQPLLFASVH